MDGMLHLSHSYYSAPHPLGSRRMGTGTETPPASGLSIRKVGDAAEADRRAAVEARSDEHELGDEAAVAPDE